MFRTPDSSPPDLCAVTSLSEGCGIRVANKHRRAHGMEVVAAIFYTWRHGMHREQLRKVTNSIQSTVWREVDACLAF